MQEYETFIVEHPKKSTSTGLPVVLAPIFLYSDDTSGNRSKKWNKFDVWCCSLACLPREKAHKSANIFFISVSNRTNALHMSDAIVQDLLSLEDGIRVYDSALHSDVIVVSPVICLLCDNARASELLNHLGSKALKLCHLCNVSIIIHNNNHKSLIIKKTADALILGEPRTKSEVLQCIHEIESEPLTQKRKICEHIMA